MLFPFFRLLLFAMAVPGMAPLPGGLPDYDLSSPFKIITLPPELREISGLTEISNTEIACIQDEKGILYTIDLGTGAISSKLTFAADGDFEGITRVKDEYYMLKSDGTLFRAQVRESRIVSADSTKLNLETPDNEGLAYDAEGHRLLIAAKSMIKGGKEKRALRYVYEYRLAGKSFNPSPVFTLSTDAIHRYTSRKHIRMPSRETKRGKQKPILKFMPSSVSVHPLSGNIYILSAVDHSLAVLDRQGTMVYFVFLDPGLFNKAEGITFLPDGTLVISNEAEEKEPTLLLFRQTGKP
jgi:uncharacterized protein YjiK